MNKKTFISNQELEFTQKLQLLFPRGVIPAEILDYWHNCPAEVIRAQLQEMFYFSGDYRNPIIKVHQKIPWRLPHEHDFNGFYFSQREVPPTFDIRNVEALEIKDINTKPQTVLSFLNENQAILAKQLNMSQLWAIYLRGTDFFMEHFSGTVFALASAVFANKDIYLPTIFIDPRRSDGKISITWQSAWTNFSGYDFMLQFK